MITRIRKNRWLLYGTAIPVLLLAITTNVHATAMYDVSTMVSIQIQNITNVTNNGTALPQIEASTDVLIDTSSSTGTGFASTGSSVFPDVRLQDSVPIGIGQGVMTQSMVSGGASLPSGTASSFVDTAGNISINNMTNDSFTFDFLIDWSYSVETSAMNPGEFAAATFDAQVNQGGSMDAFNVFFEGQVFDFFNSDTNPGLFTDSDSFVHSYTIVPNERVSLGSFSFADGHASAMGTTPGPGGGGPGNAPIPEPSTILLLGSGLAGLMVWRQRKRKTQ